MRFEQLTLKARVREVLEGGAMAHLDDVRMVELFGAPRLEGEGRHGRKPRGGNGPGLSDDDLLKPMWPQLASRVFCWWSAETVMSSARRCQS